MSQETKQQIATPSLPVNSVVNGDCLSVMKSWPDNCIDNILTDPPYAISFLAKNWDKALPGPEFWAEMLRVCKPGAVLMAFGGTRTYHRITCAIEDGGWAIRDCIMWLYSSGFPKSHNISKAIDRELKAEREVVGYTRQGTKSIFDGGKPRPATLPATLWDGYGTALAPAYEPIVIAMKPLENNYAKNAMKWGVAGINVDGGRIGSGNGDKEPSKEPNYKKKLYGRGLGGVAWENTKGRWPKNVILDEGAAAMVDEQSEFSSSSSSYRPPDKGGTGNSLTFHHKNGEMRGYNDQGYAHRFFYVAKSSPADRNSGKDGDFQNTHSTVKPTKLLEYLLKLLAAPVPGITLDPFAGSGSTCVACQKLGIPFIGIEKEAEYAAIATERLNRKRLPLLEDEYKTNEIVTNDNDDTG